ncbi:MAG: YhcH/YjgK/YiaL family protein [Oscillospiraceae bacterium]|nr:YhcH/YjgK/YiaL family protein [Oscillospiraceae bacterium]
MILGKNREAAAYRGLHPRLDRALELLNDAFLDSVGTETQYLDGDALYVTRFRYETQPPAETFFEAHRRYLDIHVMRAGCEGVELAHPAGLELFEEKGDFYAYRGEAEQRLVLRPGDFLVVFPEDAHRIKMLLNGKPETVEKVVFKILFNE